MARIYQPLQRQSDGRWDYTVSSDEEHWAHAEGYCAGPFETVFPEENRLRDFAVSDEQYAASRAEALPFAANYHGDGHATAEEARACYERYILDCERRAYEEPDRQERCQECGEWTTARVQVGQFVHLVLCPPHQDRAIVERVKRALDEKRSARR